MWNSLLIHFFLMDYSHQASARRRPPCRPRPRTSRKFGRPRLDPSYCPVGPCIISGRRRENKWDRSEHLWWLSLKSIDIATEAEPQATPAGTRRIPQGHRLSSNTKQLIRKMIFPIMTIIYTICICLLSKERGSNTIEWIMLYDSYYMTSFIKSRAYCTRLCFWVSRVFLS